MPELACGKIPSSGEPVRLLTEGDKGGVVFCQGVRLKARAAGYKLPAARWGARFDFNTLCAVLSLQDPVILTGGRAFRPERKDLRLLGTVFISEYKAGGFLNRRSQIVYLRSYILPTNEGFHAELRRVNRSISPRSDPFEAECRRGIILY